MTTESVLAYDLGGTKLEVGVLNAKGTVLHSVRVPAAFNRGKDAVIQQMIELGKDFLSPSIKKVGVAAAGPLDPKKGLLLNPTNFKGPDGRWGQVPLSKLLKKYLRRPIALENDAAAAILAEQWVGSAKNVKDAMVLTLGTGLGTGILCNGRLVRAGQGLHTEAGHLMIRYGDPTAICGCGNFGCAEAYLSGKNFAKRTAAKIRRKDLSAKQIADDARAGEAYAQSAFSEYSEFLAVAIQNFVRIYAPKIIILTGGFAGAADLFLPECQRVLEILLKNNPELIPKISVSKLLNHAGIIGAACVALGIHKKR